MEAGLIDCIVNLPAKLFLNTQIPASLWFINRNRANRKDQILFIDARNLGHLINRRTKVLSDGEIDPNDNDIKTISDTYHNWKNGKDNYENVPGFCCAAPISRVKELDFVLTPDRYVGLAVEEDDFNFNECFTSLKKEFEEQLKEEEQLNKAIAANLGKIKLT